MQDISREDFMRSLKLFLAVALSLCCIQNSWALTFIGQPPTTGTGDDPLIASAFDDALTKANAQVAKFQNQDKLARSFGDANAYASHSASMWGYQGYDNIAILGGLAMSAQIPSLDFYSLNKALKDVEEQGDAEVGVAPSGAVNLGLHLGWFSSSAKDWYINVKFFMYDLSYPFGGYDMDYSTMNLGVGINYSLVRARRFGAGSFLWRGVSLGVGFNYQQNELDYTIDLAPVSDNAYPGVDVVIDPSVKIGLKMKTYTIPIDLVSSMRILYFLNISLGAGIDFNFGESEVIAESAGSVFLSGYSGSSTPGYIYGDASTKGEPFTIRGRFMAGLGITIGPVVLADVQVTYYLLSGVGVNLSAGFVW